MTHSLTTIDIQGNQELVFEIYTDESKDQTLGYAFGEETAVLWEASHDLLEALKALMDVWQCNPDHYSDEIKKYRPLIAKAQGKTTRRSRG